MNQAESLQLTQKSPAGRLDHHTIQPKLKIGQPNDKYEQEADRVANRVMRMPDPQLQMRSKEENEKERLQMQPLKGDESLQMKPQVPNIQRMCPRCQKRATQGKPLNCPECEKELQMKPAIQKKSDGQAYASRRISSQLSASKGRGTSLPAGTEQEMSHKMGADFSGVNIHTDSKSHQLNQQLGAKAFTHGQDIYFNKSEYNPGSSEGKHLLAHELSHVVQQSASSAVHKQAFCGRTTKQPQLMKVSDEAFPVDSGNCSHVKYAELWAGVESAKAIVNGLGKCSGNDDCKRLALKIVAFGTEIAARKAMMEQCFPNDGKNGQAGSEGHRDQVQFKKDALEACLLAFVNCLSQDSLKEKMKRKYKRLRKMVFSSAEDFAKATVAILIVVLIAFIGALIASASAAELATAGVALATFAALLAILKKIRDYISSTNRRRNDTV